MIVNALVLAFREIRRNVLRSSLTTLGIIIGVSAVIVMVTLGNGATALVTSSVASMGSNLLTVIPGQERGPGGASGVSQPFELADAQVLADVPGLAAVAPVASQSLTAVVGNENWSTSVVGTTNAYFESGGRALAAGRWFTDAELRGGSAVCIIGETTRKELFRGHDPVGAALRVRTMSCSVIGLLRAKGKSAFGQDRDDTIVMPLRTFQRRIAGTDDVGQIQVSVQQSASTEKAQQDIRRLMRERRRLAETDPDDFTVFDMAEVSSTLSGITTILTALLAGVAAISLLVGGIGIMNIMLVSVTERTREIGIRLAIGALEGDVLTQFLIESVVLSVLGGLAGIALALVASFAAARAFGLPFSVDVQIVLLAFVFSAIVGVIFGFFPARRAARLNPIDALRHE